MSDSPNDKALQEFVSEAQEIVETFNHDLLLLDAQRGTGAFDPDAINSAFRAVHSLKGLAGMFGIERMTTLAHQLESLLDSLRLGRLAITPDLLDLLFEAVGAFTRMVVETAGAEGDPEGVEGLIGRLQRSASAGPSHAVEAPWGGYALDQSLLQVLTEYEEHRLKENIKAERSLYRIHVAFDLMTIDKGLEQLKAALKPVGEVITYLPSNEGGNDQQIELDAILGGMAGLGEVAGAVVALGAQVVAIPRTATTKAASPTRAAASPARAAPPPAVEAAPVEPPPGPVSGPDRAPPEPTVQGGGGSSPAEEAGEVSLKSVAQTVRVDIRKLDVLMNIVGELGLVRSGLQAVLESVRADRAQIKLERLLDRELRTFNRRLDEMQAGILEVRMVPLGQVFDKLSRVVRKISRDAGKQIHLVITGGDTELDKLIVEELSDPLMHVIRNCIDHGIERPSVRQSGGKPQVGTIAINAQQRGNQVVIEVEDDGAGLDGERLVAKAIQRGVLTPEQAKELSERELFNLIFLPGLSTKEVADELSGRGVGMDVVKTNIARLSGMIDVASERGRGTRITMTLPITLAIIQALIVRAAGRTYAIPLNSVLESLRVQSGEVSTIERHEVMTLREQTLPLARLERLFQLQRAPGETAPPRQFVVVVGLAQHRIGLLVDELLGQEDIVIKPLGKSLAGLRGIAGATELGGKRTVLVLDVAAIVEEAAPGHQVEAA